MMFAQCYVLNLDRRSDRWDAFNERLPRPWPWGVPQRFSAFDGRLLRIPERWTATPGAYGCYLSHKALLERISETSEPALIVEDDCLFCEDFADRAERFLWSVPGDWHQLYFGGQHDETPEQVVPGVMRCRKTRRTHAYAVSPKGVLLLLNAVRRGFNHVDALYWAEHKRINAYCPEEWLCGQAAGPSDIFGFNQPGHQPENWWPLEKVPA